MSDDWRGAMIAEFRDAEKIVEALRRTKDAGYSQIDAFAPFPVKGMTEALELREDWLAWVATAGFVFGAAAGYLMQWYLNAVNYPINVGGRPLAAWPAFALPAFELGVLSAVLAALLAMLIKDRLPRLHHPLFDLDRFALVSRDRFFLAVSRGDPRFRSDVTRQFLASLGPERIDEVPG
jgi:hypothetical protein